MLLDVAIKFVTGSKDGDTFLIFFTLTWKTLLVRYHSFCVLLDLWKTNGNFKQDLQGCLIDLYSTRTNSFRVYDEII